LAPLGSDPFGLGTLWVSPTHSLGAAASVAAVLGKR